GQRRLRMRAGPRISRRLSLYARRLPVDVSREALDDATVRRLRHRGGDERPLPLSARARPDGLVDGVRHAHADGPRLRPRAVAGRGRPRGCRDRLPRRHADALRRHPVSISGYHMREAGSTAAQELAFTLADGFAYVEACIERGLDVDDFAPRLSFFFNAHLDFFEEIAQYRAARRIWARELRERYGAKNPRSWLMRFHTQTAGVSLTAQQPEVNIVRTALEALAAVLGGTQ